MASSPVAGAQSAAQATRAELDRSERGVAAREIAPELQRVPVKSRPLLPSQRYTQIEASEAEHVVLPALDKAKLLSEDAKAMQDGRKQVRVGATRETNLHSASHGRVVHLPDGSRVHLLRITSPEAVGMRLHFTGVELPDGATLQVSGVGESAGKAETFEGKGPFGSGEFWTSAVAGETARIELWIPAGVSGGVTSDFARTGYSIPEISHFYLDPTKADVSKAADSCNVDVQCHADWANTAKSVARISFQAADGQFLCTGTLVTNGSNDVSPLFLTANHCVNSAEVARTVQFYWQYTSTGCNTGAPVSLASVPTSAGAALLATRTREQLSDFALLEALGTVPRDRTWAGYNLTDPGLASLVSGVHHPAGDYMRIAFGAIHALSDANYHLVRWTSGTTEGGSSGSALFNDQKQIVGQLYGGFSSCSNPAGTDQYGKLSKSAPLMAPVAGANYLAAGLGDDAAEPNNSISQAYRIQPDTSRNGVVRINNEDWFAVSVPAGAQLIVQTQFTHNFGDIDIEAYKAGVLAGSSKTVNNIENLTLQNGASAGDYLIRVFLNDDTRNTYSLTVSTKQSGSSPLLSVSATSLTLPTVAVGATSAAQTVQLTNRGSAAAVLSMSTNDSTFAVDTGAGFCGAILAVGQSCTIAVRYTPMSTGAVTGVLTIQPTAGAAVTVQLSGAGARPSNDEFLGASVISSMSYRDVTSTMAATQQPGVDPIPACGAIDGRAPQNGATVWYRFTPTGPGTVHMDTAGSEYDTLLSVWTGEPGAFTSVICNDDIAGDVTSSVSFSVTGGAAYHILVSSWSGPGGPLTLTFNSSVGGEAAAPAITSLSPSHRDLNSGAFTMTVNGLRFTPATRVRLNNSERQTTFVSATVLQASVSAADVQTGGNLAVTAVEGGTTSNAATLRVSDFQMRATSTAEVTVSQGQPGRVAFAVEPRFGSYGQQVTFACTGLPAGTRCDFSQPGVTPNGSPVSAEVTISRTQSAAISRSESHRAGMLFAFAFPLALVFAVRGKRGASGMCCILLLAAGLAACGGGGGGASKPPVTSPSTTPSPGLPGSAASVAVEGRGPGGTVRSFSVSVRVQ